MKRKLSYAILLCLSLILVSSFVVYAAFVMTHNYEADVDYHQIVDGTLTSEPSELNANFNNPGDQISYTLGLKNNDKKNYEYYYELSLYTTPDAESDSEQYLDMIYVYLNDKYCGVLREFVNAPKADLPVKGYVFAGETVNDKFTFELHNGIKSYIANEVSVGIIISANIVSSNYQTNLFVGNAENFDKVVLDVKSEPGKTVILSDDITTNSAFTISKDCTIDLCGNNLTLGGDVEIGSNVNVKIVDSRGGGTISGGMFNLNDETSFVDIQTPAAKDLVDVKNYNKKMLIKSLTVKYSKENYLINSAYDYDLLGNYSAYTPTITVDGTKNTGIIAADSTLDTNKVIKVVIFPDDNVNIKEFEFKYIGSDAELFLNIVNDNLKHLTQFIGDNSIRVSYDLFLPTAINENNVTISWHSSNEAVIDNNGVIGSGEGIITLTATIKIYDKVYIQKYNVYVVQEDNLTKLQYLATQVQKGLDVEINGKKPNVILTAVNEYKYLPVAGDKTKTDYHYTLWTDGENFGIDKLEYEIESIYDYISLAQDATSAAVYLNKITYEKSARIKMIGTFGESKEEVYISITITLNAAQLADDVFEDAQDYLNNVNVLQNILDTREQKGVLYESGNFKLKSRIDVLDIKYSAPDKYKALYEVVTIDGEQYVYFKDMRELGLTDKTIEIIASIDLGEGDPTSPKEKMLTFLVPGAVTTTNFVKIKEEDYEVVEIPIFDMDDENLKALFYSFKYQTLQQSTNDPLYIEGTYLNELSTLADVYKLGNSYNYETKTAIEGQTGYREYILMHDIKNEKTKKLIFEYADNINLVDYYDLDVLDMILTWARDTNGVSVTDSGFKNYVDSGLGWIESEPGIISDGEITVILSYTERYSGFKDIWYGTDSEDGVINVFDNTLSDSDVNKLLKTLVADEHFIYILDWIMDTENGEKSISEWYDLSTDLTLPASLSDLSTLKGDGLEYVSNDEERILIYYVMSKHGYSSKKYKDFYGEWKKAIERSNDGENNLKKIGNSHTINQIITAKGTTSNSSFTPNPSTCYDPVFAAILNWITKCSETDPEGAITDYLEDAIKPVTSNEKLLSYLQDDGKYLNTWCYNSFNLFFTITTYGDMLNENEWDVLWRYLALYGIDEIQLTVGQETYSYNYSENPDIPNDDTANVMLADSQVDSGQRLTSQAVSYLITQVNSKYSATTNNSTVDVADVASYNSLVDWAKSTETGFVAWKNIISTYDIDMDDYRINDANINISNDEYLVLTSYFDNCLESVLGTLENRLLKEVFKAYYIKLDMSFDNQEITDAEYNTIVNQVESLGTFNTDITNVKELYKGENPTTTDGCDNLSTISRNEFEYLANASYANANFKQVLNQVITAYSVDANNNVSEVRTIGNKTLDRDLSDSDVNKITDAINEKLDNHEDSKVYKYLTLNQIAGNDVDVFKILSYYSNIEEIMLRGTSANYLFESNADANLVFNTISTSCSSLERLIMNYTGISDISSISSLLNLVYLDLSNNYTYNSYEGLNSINPLIFLNDLKDINKTPRLAYLNIVNTDVLFIRAEAVLSALYNANNNAVLIYEYDGVEVIYNPNDLSQDAIIAISLLYEITEMKGTHIILPKYVYTSSNNYLLEWDIVVGNSLIYNESDYIIKRLGTGSGEVTISASLTIKVPNDIYQNSNDEYYSLMINNNKYYYKTFNYVNSKYVESTTTEITKGQYDTYIAQQANDTSIGKIDIDVKYTRYFTIDVLAIS